MLASRVDGSQLGDENSIIRWLEKSSRMVPLKFAFLDTLLESAIPVIVLEVSLSSLPRVEIQSSNHFKCELQLLRLSTVCY